MGHELSLMDKAAQLMANQLPIPGRKFVLYIDHHRLHFKLTEHTPTEAIRIIVLSKHDLDKGLTSGMWDLIAARLRSHQKEDLI